MKCPYQSKIVHIPERLERRENDTYVTIYAQDVTEFGECAKSNCPFYYTSWSHEIVEHCRRAEREEER